MAYDLAIVGCGAIGGHIARTVQAWPQVERIHLVDEVPGKADALAAEVDGGEAVELGVAVEEADVVVEAAAQDAVADVGKAALSRGRVLVVLSVGALADADLLEALRELAGSEGGTIRVPSGAVGGLDALAAARQAGLDRVKLTTTKSPKSLGMEDVDEARTLFTGPARQAVREYPENVNVAAALSLCGVGFDDTGVEIVVDPSVERNRHRIDAEGAFGTFTFEVANDPFPENPKTSFLAALSALALLERLDADLVVGP